MSIWNVCIGHLCTTVPMSMSEDNFVESVFFFHIYTYSEDQTQTIRFAQQASLLILLAPVAI